jgi:NAD-dependent deacetylase
VIAQVLRRSKKVVFLTGAGISAESGIPTFRGADGFWTIGSETYRPQEMATYEMFGKHPDELWKWYHMRWGICRNASPNPGHFAVATLEKLIRKRPDSSFHLITQNIDGLHLAAGSRLETTFQVHGSMNFMRCDEQVEGACCHGICEGSQDPEVMAKLRSAKMPWGKEWSEEEVEANPIPTCPKCGSRCRPHVLWFDEAYNEAWYNQASALEAADNADCIVVVGTTLTTGLPSRIVHNALARKIPIVNLDPSAAEEPRKGMLNMAAKSGETLPRIIEKLKALYAEPDLAPERSKPLGTPPKKSLSSFSLAAGKSAAPRRRAPAVAAPAGRRRTLEKPAAKAASDSTRSATPESSRSATPEPPSPNDAVSNFFVYGTLRPDDDSGAAWTEAFSKGVVSAQTARLAGASLYHENYPSVVLEDTKMCVRGMLLRVQPTEWSAKLEEADKIEGYPSLYDRSVETVQLLDDQGKVVGEERAWVYHRTGKVDRAAVKRIPDGDWLSRIR